MYLITTEYFNANKRISIYYLVIRQFSHDAITSNIIYFNCELVLLLYSVIFHIIKYNIDDNKNKYFK